MRAALGHVYTITRHLVDGFRPPPLTAGVPFRVDVADEHLGPVPLVGQFHAGQAGAPLLALVHGLGGSIESGYVRRMAMSAIERGYAVLRLNLRGADRGGADIYHAGLTADIRAALESSALSSHTQRAVIGFSLGGHVSLRFAAESSEAIDAAVAICAPLDLAAGAAHIDSRSRRIYCRHLLRGLVEIYERSVSAIGAIVGTTVDEARRISSIREWDDKIVARRFGFGGATDYYAKASVLPMLNQLTKPTLMIRAESDPMISPAAAALQEASLPSIEIWRERGGHIGFPSGSRIESRVLDWLSATLES